MNIIRFGPSGNSESFYQQGFTSSVQMPKWLNKMGLSAYEYSCTKGIRIGEEKARQLGQEALINKIALSLHAPYYINMSSPDVINREKSKNYVLETLNAAKWMSAQRVVVHVGSCSHMDRDFALNLAIETLSSTLNEADQLGLSSIAICPEVLGKINQLGSLSEILKICSIDERLIPTIDFGHIHARTMGGLNSVEDFAQVIEEIEDILGTERAKKIHCHFSRVEFTKGGERRHKQLKDILFGPEFKYLAEVIYKKQLAPTIICESSGNMAEDALTLKNIYYQTAKEIGQ